MNERIRKLAFESAGGLLRYDERGFMLYEDEVEKFAELIVRECADVLDNQIAPPNHPMNSLGYKLKQHFGVDDDQA